MRLVEDFERAAATGDVETGALLIAGHAMCSTSTTGAGLGLGPADDAVDQVVMDGRHDLDRVASGLDGAAVADLVRFLFGPEGFTGNSRDYYNPANSMLPLVIRSRMGNPITLSVLAMSVGRRLGIELDGVGMPAHFILRDRADPPTWIDPFGGGQMMDARATEQLLARVTSGQVAFDASYLQAVPVPHVLARMLGNLQQIYGQNEAHHHLAWVGRLSAALSSVRPGTAGTIAAHLAKVGRYGQAASVYAAAAHFENGARQERLQAKANDLWSRLN